MKSQHQFSLTLIQHKLADATVQQRAQDGYINATSLCAAAGKMWHQYAMREGGFLRALSQSTGLAADTLTQEVITPEGVKSVWVHPRVAVHLGQWLSPQFAVKVSEWVHDWMDGKGPARAPAELPYHVQRHMLNAGKIPGSHFSILQEMTFTLTAPMEMYGHSIPANVVPDISQGKLFCQYAREQLGLDTDALPTYEHEYPDGRKVQAKLYPVEYLGHFRKFVNEVWMATKAGNYFRPRDPAALPYIDKMLSLTTSVAKPAIR